MRIAVISDIHGNSVAFDEIMDDINLQNVEEVIFLGDLLSKGPDPKGAFDRIKSIKPIVWIKGNSDTWFDKDLSNWQPKSQMEKYYMGNYKFILECLPDNEIEFIRRLPEKQSLEINNFKVLCVHGSPRRVGEDLLPDIADEELEVILDGVKEEVILSGHIHEPYMRKVFNKIIINPGTVGVCNCYGDRRASYVIIEFGTDIKVEFRKIEYDHQVAMNLAKVNGLPNIDMFEMYIKISREKSK